MANGNCNSYRKNRSSREGSALRSWNLSPATRADPRINLLDIPSAFLLNRNCCLFLPYALLLLGVAIINWYQRSSAGASSYTMTGPSIDPATLSTISAKIDYALTQLSIINKKLDSHEERLSAWRNSSKRRKWGRCSGATSSTAPRLLHRRPQQHCQQLQRCQRSSTLLHNLLHRRRRWTSAARCLSA